VLVCPEAPTLRVRLERGLAVSASAARSHPPGAIFLDGAAQGEPFADPERAVYNLDHHEGCVRSFTLACCEQAMVLVRKGLDLRGREWTLYANDADLDVLLAIWILLNHLRLNDADPRPRRRVMPLVRLQGAIDAHGLDLEELCALPPELYRRTRAQMDRLREPELELKSEGRWSDVDLLEYAVDRLHVLDALVYSPGEFAGVAEIEELERVEIAGGSVAVVCRANVGIYEVERQLRRTYGRRLGLVCLQKDPASYSLRQVDASLPANLEKLYAHLNWVDPATGGNPSANRWGGSAEIGGSPRAGGTRLEARQIAEVCRIAYRVPGRLERLARLAGATLAGGLSLAALTAAPLPGLVLGEGAGEAGAALASFAAALALLAVGLLLATARHTPRFYGLRRPVGADWALALPLVLAGAAAGGSWLPEVPGGAGPLGAAGLALLLAPLSAELLFRGFVQGSLTWAFPPARARAGLRPSLPAALAAALYALWTGAAVGLGPLLGSVQLSGPLLPGPTLLVAVGGALLLGLTLGVVRERSESLLPPILLHLLGVTGMLALGQLGPT
jgi:membrane protease YdiL (CAAX protease family)